MPKLKFKESTEKKNAGSSWRSKAKDRLRAIHEAKTAKLAKSSVKMLKGKGRGRQSVKTYVEAKTRIQGSRWAGKYRIAAPRELVKILPPVGLPWPLALLPKAVAQGAPRGKDEIFEFKSEIKKTLQIVGGANAGRKATALAALRAPSQGIIGVGFGAKITDGKVVSNECVRVYVKQKLPASRVPSGLLVPSQVNGLPTDVIESPFAVAQVQCGVSVGQFAITAGTLGCLVTKNGETFILSNNHILANCNNAAPGDNILQPGPLDGGVPPPIAHLYEFQPLDFGGGQNAIDAAIAQLVNVGSVTPGIQMIGALSPNIATAVSGLAVKKCGRTTNLTSGYIEGLSEDVTISYGASGSADFVGQIAVRGANGLFSQGGDSGALIVTADGNQPVALLFAGDESNGLTFASGISGVLGHFGVTIVV